MNAPVFRKRCGSAHPQYGFLRAFCLVFVGVLVGAGYSDCAQGADLDGDDAAKTVSTLPNIYLDLRTIYSSVPANTLAIGFSNPSSISSAIARLQTLSTLPNSSNLSSPASQSVGINVPLTIDLNDRYRSMAGLVLVRRKAVRPDGQHLDQQLECRISGRRHKQTAVCPHDYAAVDPHEMVPDSPLATTSLNNIVEFNYALNKDETKGLLADVQYVAVGFDSRWPKSIRMLSALSAAIISGTTIGN